MNYLNNKKQCFTLAETLITLAIIGVVAAITIPSIMQKTQEQELKTAWKKNFSEISNVYNLIKQEHGGSLSEYFDGVTQEISRPLMDDFAEKLVSSCKKLNSGILCTDVTKNLVDYSASYKTLDGDTMHYYNLSYGNLSLNSGALIFFRMHDPNNGLIWVDVNGYQKGPNVVGKDLFGMIVNKEKILPMGAPNTYAQNSCNTTPKTCAGSGWHTSPCAGAGCSAEYLYN